MSIKVRGILYTCVSEGDNPYDKRKQPKEQAAWHDAYCAVRLELGRQHESGVGGGILKEDARGVVEQCQFALVWRPFVRPFRLRVHDVVRIDNRLGRVIRVTECAAVVLVNPPPRTFITRFDKQVRFQPKAVTVRISANSGTEILNRRINKKRRNLQTERRSA